MERKLKVLDLFSGIGGFALGLDSTGFFETVKFVEMDKYCQKVLQKNFPNIPIEEDIKNVKGKEYEADVVVGGFPCQPFSVAGKQKGTDDNRYLWPEMLRLIREIKPEFVIGENVQGIINLQDGMVLRQVQDQLESEGFEVQCFLIPASGIGAWHQRYRVWIVGHSEHNGSLASKIKRRDTETATRTQEGKNETSEPERTSGSRDNEDVSNTDTRLSIGENEEVQTRRDTVDSSSSRGGEENVSNTEIIGTRESRNINQKKRNESSGSTQSDGSGKDVSNTNNTRGRASKHGIEREGKKVDEGWKRQSQSESSGHSKNVSNTDSGLRGRGRTIQQSGENKVWRFYSEEEEQARVDIWSETIGRDALSREGEKENVTNTNDGRTEVSIKRRQSSVEMSGSDGKKRRDKHVLQSNNKRQQEFNISKESEKQNISDWRHDTNETKQTWWQTESDLCGVPNGISYELDKNRANRIKTLGNAIVPQIAREFGLAIKKVLSDEDII